MAIKVYRASSATVSFTTPQEIVINKDDDSITVFQGTSPWIVSGTVTGPLTDAQLRATPVPVSGTFFQATQPVSGTVAVSNFPATQAVTQSTSPWIISGAVTDTQLRATPIPVSGTVSATQSGTWTVQQGGAPWSVSSKVALTASSPTAATVGVTSAQAVATNGSRKGLILTNTSSTASISFGLGAAAVLNSGITLTPYGVWVMDEFTFTTGAINAIASLASTNLAIQEMT